MNTVNVPWSKPRSLEPDWNLTAALIIEHFGLPGNKYTTEMCVECIAYHFKDEKDALMCKILVSQSI